MINAIQVEDDEDKALVESLSKIKGVKVLFAEKDVDGVAMYKEALGLIKGKDFEELMSVRDEDKDIKFYIKEKGNKIDEMFMVMGGVKEFVMVSIVGDGIDINQLYKLSKSLGMDEFKHLGGK
jgi:predicted P-loop ATPase/GTPase